MTHYHEQDDVTVREIPRLRYAAIGWVVGVAVGAALALLMQRLRLAEAAVLPWVVLSQTVPLIAIAPLVRRWGAQIEIGSFSWSNENSVAVIAAYLGDEHAFAARPDLEAAEDAADHSALDAPDA